jgi:hypothetical protein
MTTPADSNEGRSSSSGTTRTPPPRTRRGAPATRTSFEELDALDDLLDPEPGALPDPGSEASAPTAPRGSGTRGKPKRPTEPKSPTEPKRSTEPKPDSASSRERRAGRPPGPKPAPGSTEAFDWETDDERADREAKEAAIARRSTRARTTTSNRNATALAPTAAAEVYGDPLEPEIAFEPAPIDRPRGTKPAKRPERRFRQTVQKIDLWSVTKMALCFYVSAMGVVVVSLIALWVVAESAGIIDNVENFVGDLFSSDDFQLVSGQVLRGAVLIGVVFVALMVAFTIIAASFYNIFAELFGGVEIVIREEEQPPKR